MIRVVINLESAIDRARDAKLAEILIANDGTGTGRMGNYNVVMYDRRGHLWKRGRVEGFPRADRTVSWLLKAALESCLGGKEDERP